MLPEWMRAEFAGRVPIDMHILLPGAVTSGLNDGGTVDPPLPRSASFRLRSVPRLRSKGWTLVCSTYLRTNILPMTCVRGYKG